MKAVAGSALLFFVSSIVVAIFTAPPTRAGGRDREHEADAPETDAVGPASTQSEIALQEVLAFQSDVTVLVSRQERLEAAISDAKGEALRDLGLVVVDISKDGAIQTLLGLPGNLSPEGLGKAVSTSEYPDGSVVVFEVSPVQIQTQEGPPKFEAAASAD